MGRNGLACAAMLLLCHVAVHAEPVGVLHTTGSLTVSATSLAFATSAAPPTSGVFTAIQGSSGLILDLTMAPAPPLANFITFDALPGSSITLTGLGPGSFGSDQCFVPPAVGQGCSLSGSPINFTNTGGGVAASIAFEGTYENATGQDEPVSGVLTFQVAGDSYQSVLATIAGGGSVTASYSGAVDAGSAGTFSVAGSGVALTAAGIDFSPGGGGLGALTIGSPPGGSFEIGSFGTGSFAALSGTTGMFTADVSGPALPNVAVFLAEPALTLDLLSLLPGGFGSVNCFSPPAAGQTCTPPGSILEFTNIISGQGLSSMLSFSFDMLAKDAFGSTPYLGLFTTQFAGLSYQQLLSMLAGGASVTGLYSAGFVPTGPGTPIPEPAAGVLALAGLGAAALGRRR